MAGPRSSVSSKRKRPEVVTAPVPRRPRRDNAAGTSISTAAEPTTDPEKAFTPTTTTTAANDRNNSNIPTPTTSTPTTTTTTKEAKAQQQQKQQQQLHPTSREKKTKKNSTNTTIKVDDEVESSSCVEHDEDENQPKTLSLEEQNKNQEAADAAIAAAEVTAGATAIEPSLSPLTIPTASTGEPSRLQEVLSHRKVLLERVRQGRIAAQKRIDEIHEQDPKRTDETPEQEVVNFKEICRLATSLARKQQGSMSDFGGPAGGGGGSAESKRTSLSLRRGSSVGKRMNAALSALSGTTTAAATTISAAATTTTITGGITGSTTAASASVLLSSESEAAAIKDQPQSTAITQQSQQATVGQVIAVKAPATQLATSAATNAVVTALNTQHSSTTGLLSAAEPSPSSSSSLATTPRVATTMGRPLKKSTQHSQSAIPSQQLQPQLPRPPKRPASATGAGASRSGSVSGPKGGRQQQQLSSLQQQQQLSSAAAAAAARAAQQQPLVICPEAIALRERRKLLEGKLTQLFVKRRDGVVMSSSVSPSSPSSCASVATTTALSSPSQQQQQSLPLHQRQNSLPPQDIPPKILVSALKGPPCDHFPQQPYVYPPRRKTHWDYVLEEMRWLATDFIEERKWKVSAARHVAGITAVRGRATLSPREGAATTIKTPTAAEASPEKSASTTAQTRAVVLATEYGGTSGLVEPKTIKTNEASCDSDESCTSDHRGRRIFAYAEVSGEDLVQAKEVALIMSSMIQELTSTVEKSGVANPESKDEYAKALERHILFRNRLKGVQKPKSDFSGDMEMTDATVVSPTENGEVELPNSDAVAMTSEPSSFDNLIPGAESEKAKLLARISEFVDSVVAKVEAKVDLKDADAENVTSSLPLPFTPSAGQLLVMERIEDLWLRASAGVVLGGPLNSGKTLVTCALLWKLRLDGPQLIVCSPLSMIRWMHEIDRFDGLNRRARAMDAGISSPVPVKGDYSDFKSSDIVFCEFAALSTFTADELSTFRSIVVDSRHPSGFFGSRAPVYEEQESILACGVDGMETPPELLSTSWWTQLCGFAKDLQVRRLLIESSSPSKTLRFFYGMPDRQLLEVLALRFAFLIGASGFLLPGFSLAKSVLAWARRKVKNSQEKGTKFERTRSFVVSITESFYCQIEDGKVLEEVGLGSSTTVWDLHLCKMPSEQRVAYDKLCREARAALSMTMDAKHRKLLHLDPLRLAADFMFRLRQLCIHSNFKAVLKDSRLHAAKMMSGGPSQPNYYLAAQILKGSGKLRELLSILVYDCDVHVPEFEFLEPLLRHGGHKAKGGNQKESAGRFNRIIILASLPEAQLLVTLLLNSVCIEHVSFLCPFTLDSGGRSLDVELQTVSWAGSQLILSRFNDEKLEVSRKCPFLVVAPVEAIAGDNCGLGAELADLVICLDEDWSGRGELQMKSLVGRCISRRRWSKGDTSRFIKLITADSCEHSFLSSTGGATQTKKRQGKTSQMLCWPWPVEPYGSFVAKLSFEDVKDRGEYWSHRSPGSDFFAFPASNVTNLRDEVLSDVLSVSGKLPSLFTFQADLLFLPVCNGVTADLEFEMLFTAYLMKREMDTFCKTSWGQIRRQIQPPQLLNVPYHVGRLDLEVLPSRLHLQYVNRHVPAIQQPTAVDVSAVPLQMEAVGLPLSSDSSDVMDVSADDSPSRNAENSIESLLFYGCFPVDVDDSKRRINAYSSLFSMWNISGLCVDGNSGAEPLVYFPPLFPRLLECSEMAHTDFQARRTLDSCGTNKRASDTLSLPLAKRPRLDSDSFTDLLALNDPDEAILSDISLSNEKAAVEPGLITADEASQNDAVSVLLDLSDDYGVVGIGAVPLLRDSAMAAASASVSARPISWEKSGEWWSDRFPCDSEEAHMRYDTALDSMILFVRRKRPRGLIGYSTQNHSAFSFQRMQSSAPIWASGINTHGEMTDYYADVNGAGKKTKKKLLNPKETGAGLSAFNRLSSSDHTHPPRPLNPGQTTMPVPKSRDIFRSRLLMRLRQSSGSTLFDAPAFRTASVRVRQRIADRLDQNGWTSCSLSEAASTVAKESLVQSLSGPFHGDTQPWTSIVKHLKSEDAMAGDEAVGLSEEKSVAFRRSNVIPSRVDFGPFQSGYICSTSGMTSVAPVRPRVGVSLPMGVKLPGPRDSTHLSWSNDDSALLRHSVGRFGMNWVLASSVLNGLRDFAASSRINIPKSPKTCRDHWQAVAMEGREATLVKPTRVHDSGSRHEIIKADLSSLELALDCTAPSFLLPASPLVDGVTQKGADFCLEGSPNDDVDMGDKQGDPGQLKPKRSFDRIMAAKARQQAVPISIPGIASGSPPALVASHPSHMQSVQASAASSYTSGRTEMWPLQLLDAADRQRTSLTTTTTSSTSVPVQSQPTVSRTTSIPSPSGSNGGARPSGASSTGAASLSSQRSSFTRVQRPPTTNNNSSGPSPSSSTSPPVTPQAIGATPRSASQNRSSSSSIQSFIPPAKPYPLPLSTASQQQPPQPVTKSIPANQSSPADHNSSTNNSITKDSSDPKLKS